MFQWISLSMLLSFLTFPFFACSLKKLRTASSPNSSDKKEGQTSSTSMSKATDSSEKEKATELESKSKKTKNSQKFEFAPARQQGITRRPPTPYRAVPPTALPPPPHPKKPPPQIALTSKLPISSPPTPVFVSPPDQGKPKIQKNPSLTPRKFQREKEKKMQISMPLDIKEGKRKMPSKTAVNKKSIYVKDGDEVDALGPKSPSLRLDSTQIESQRTFSIKEDLLRKRDNLKIGEFNENSDDTFEDAPSLPKKACPSYDQLAEQKSATALTPTKMNEKLAGKEGKKQEE